MTVSALLTKNKGKLSIMTETDNRRNDKIITSLRRCGGVDHEHLADAWITITRRKINERIVS